MSLRVLIVEDDERIAGVLVRRLREEGDTVSDTEDGEAAGPMLRGGGWDLVILDWWLPGQDGPTILRRFRQDDRATPVLFLTARDGVGDRVRGLDGGADDDLCKPFAFEELLARVRALTRRRDEAEIGAMTYRDLRIDLMSQRAERGGQERRVSVKEVPVSVGITGVVLELEPGAIRELHWHPNSDEWQYWIEGSGRVGVFGSHARSRTEEFSVGDAGDIPLGGILGIRPRDRVLRDNHPPPLVELGEEPRRLPTPANREGPSVESISVFDIFKIGVGPSSSHTMGPWRAAQQFEAILRDRGDRDRVISIVVDLYGSLAKTGKGHGTDIAVLMGLVGEDPVTCDPAQIHPRVASIRALGKLRLGDGPEVEFDYDSDLRFHFDQTLPFHPNGLKFTAGFRDGSRHSETFYSIGGGFVVREGDPHGGGRLAGLPMPIETPAELVGHCRTHGLTIPQVVMANERVWRDDPTIRQGLLFLWETMRQCVFRGSQIDGILPGGLNVVRRAAAMSRKRFGDRKFADVDSWMTAIRSGSREFREILGWVSCFALAVNEENAAFGRVVTAPTNGAAGVIPAVLMYYTCFREVSDDAIVDFLLTAGEVGSLFKKGATISAAMGGCQAEIGVSSAMAASGLCQVSGGTVDQVLMAAEIAMEHHLGLTCDPVGGLVQIPCIERNTMGAIKAITACDIALGSDPKNAKVTLDAVIRSMWATAQDMSTKYKETSEGGLAIQIPVNLSEC